MQDAQGAYSCQAAVLGNSTGNQNPSASPPFVDAWGNAWDTVSRSAANFSDANSSCESLGGRLPLAGEIYRVRQNQTVPGVTSLGNSGSTNHLWTLNPDYRDNYHSRIAIQDGSTNALVDTSLSTYRCIWPTSKPDAFSGHACYGEPSDPCFEDNRLRIDRYDRPQLPQPAAQYECAFYGGRLPTLYQYAESVHAGRPNTPTNTSAYNWTREWAYWNDGNTYAFLARRGSNADPTQWQYNSLSDETGWAQANIYHNFRCTFSDVME